MSSRQRRVSERQRTLLEARIVFNNRFSIIECLVRDLSATGAKIVFAHPIEIPPRFELEILSKKQAFLCEVRWSEGKTHGLKFLDRPARPESTSRDQDSSPGGWLIKVTLTDKQPYVRVFAVAEDDPGKSMAVVIQNVDVTTAKGFEPVGPINSASIRKLGLASGESVDLSG